MGSPGLGAAGSCAANPGHKGDAATAERGVMTDTILLVDDDQLILQMARDVLERAGYQTICLQEGRALEATVA